ncbi:MAG: flagellar biosynthetic protein FliR [Phycisphaerae bacterium]
MKLLALQMMLPGFVLVLARTAGLVLAVPMFSSSQIPRIVKVWMSVTLALMTFPAVMLQLPPSLSMGRAAGGIVGEFIIGEVIGLGAGLVFFGAQLAGKIISYQTGMALGAVFNPVFDAESTVLDQIWFFTALMFFLALRGHLAVVQVVLHSFVKLPPLSVWSTGITADFCASVLQSVFEMGVRLAGPAVLALLLTSLSMGILTRTMPQLNVLSVGFSVKIALGVFVMAVSISASDSIMAGALADGLDDVGLWFDHVADTVTYGG